MKISLKKGFSFGLASGVVTTLGLMVGLNSSTHLTNVVLGGIIIIAVADGLSDAMGIHFSQESEGKFSAKEVWESTIMTFLSKFIFTMSFTIPVLLFEVDTAIWISIAWGTFLITLYSYQAAKESKVSALHSIVEHLMLLFFVVGITHLLGDWIGTFA